METDSVHLQAYKEEQHRLGDWTSGPLLIESWQDDSKKMCVWIKPSGQGREKEEGT